MGRKREKGGKDRECAEMERLFIPSRSSRGMVPPVNLVCRERCRQERSCVKMKMMRDLSRMSRSPPGPGRLDRAGDEIYTWLSASSFRVIHT